MEIVLESYNRKRFYLSGDTIRYNRVCASITQDAVFEDKDVDISVLYLDQALIPQRDYTLDPLPRLSIALGGCIDLEGLGVLQRMGERIQFFNDVAMEMNLQEIHEDIQHLLNDCFKLLQTLEESSLEPFMLLHGLNWDLVYQMVEQHVMEQTYDIVFFKIGHEHQSNDLELAQILLGCKHLSLSQLGVAFKYGMNLPGAITKIERMAMLRTPVEKLQALVKCIRLLSERGFRPTDSPMILSGDQLIPLLIFIVVHCNIVNFDTNLDYIKRFIFEKNSAVGEEGYAISSLEAVVDYIKTNQLELLRYSRQAESFFVSLNGQETIVNGLDLTDVDGSNAVMLAASQDLNSLESCKAN